MDEKCIAGAQGAMLPRYEPSPDRWGHRSALMQCETCMWFVCKPGGPPVDRGNELGRCRRRAPTLGGYPAVFSGDWCGDHKLDENKVR